MFKLPIDIHKRDAALSSISFQPRCCVIVIPSSGMNGTRAHKKLLEVLEKTLGDIRRSERPFGGIVFVLAGDFRQTLPVIQKATLLDCYNARLKRSPLWSNFLTLTLRTNMRVSSRGEAGAQNFSDQLLKMGDGRPPFEPGSPIVFPQGL